MSFPSEPNAIRNGWIAKMCKPFTEWCKRRQPIPDANDFLVSESPDGVRFSLSKQIADALAAVSAEHRLQLSNASAAGTPKVKILYGMIAGFVADSGMTDPTNATPFLLTLPGAAGTKYIYCSLPASYDSSGKWTFDPGSITYGTSVPSDTGSNAYVEIGSVQVQAITGGYTVVVNKPQTISGDQAVARDGDGDAEFHKNWLV